PVPPAQDDEPVWAIPVHAEPVQKGAALAAEIAEIADAEPEAGDEEVAWVEEVADSAEPASRRKKRKRKKQRQSDRPEKSSFGAGIWWGISVGALALITLPIVAWAVNAGHTAELIVDAIYMGVLFPVSLVVLVISMLLASHFAGGIDFGEVQTAIPK